MQHHYTATVTAIPAVMAAIIGVDGNDVVHVLLFECDDKHTRRRRRRREPGARRTRRDGRPVNDRQRDSNRGKGRGKGRRR